MGERETRDRGAVGPLAAGRYSSSERNERKASMFVVAFLPRSLTDPQVRLAPGDESASPEEGDSRFVVDPDSGALVVSRKSVML